MPSENFIEPRASLFQILLYTIALVGVQFAWSAELVLVTPYFNSVLNADDTINHFVWAAGPISGFVIGPIVGVYSDSCTSRWGRRRPFILAGLILTVIAMAIFSNSAPIGDWLGDHKVPAKHPKWIGIGIAIASFLFMDLSINTVQGPLRALVSDLTAVDQQNLGQSIATLMQAVGAITGNLVIYLFKDPTQEIRNIFIIGYSLLSVTVAITLVAAKERQFHPVINPELAASNPYLAPFVEVGRGVIFMSPEMKRLCAVQFFGWLSWFTFLPYVSNWMGVIIYNGNPDAPTNSTAYKNYEQGLTATALANIIQSAVQFMSSFVNPHLSHWFGLRKVFFVAFCIQAGCLLAMGFIHNKIAAIALVATLGTSFAATNIFPFSLIGIYFKDAAKQGLNIGILNWFIVLPQFLDTIWAGFVAKQRTGAAYLAQDALVLFIGGVFALVAAVATTFLIIYPGPTHRVGEGTPEQDEVLLKKPVAFGH